MRAILVLLAIAALAAATLMYFGFITFGQVRPGSVQVQTPRFEADVGRVGVGTENRTVTVPRLEVERPADNSQAR